MTKYEILNKINSPDDIKAVSEKDIPKLCEQIREFLIENVEKQGGHLASNLGVTELSVALHRVFDSPRDHIIFDVGHQSYVHKMLTGRRELFDTLRKPGGLSGFTSIKESSHDAFGAGHSSTSVSAALGYAEADKMRGVDAYSIAVVGDGAYTGGMVHEALNNCKPGLKLIIILNENGMSISMNKGSFATYISKARLSKGYRGLKSGTKATLSKIPLIGKPLAAFFAFLKNSVKKLFFSPNYFEHLGLYYIGPIDGNNYRKVESALREAKNIGGCVVVHLKTKKGKGYQPAENSPDNFHSVYLGNKKADSFHSVFTEKLISKAEKDENIVAVTAAMGMGTGLSKFEKRFPKRYFDVGIAEEHALTFSAGLAASRLKPFVAIYSTFLQRGYDSIIHDISLQKLPVKIIVDRAGLAVSDGPTHHGIFDVAFLSHIPNMVIYSPITYGSLSSVIEEAIDTDSPVAIRYPNASENEKICKAFYPDGDYSDFGVRADFGKDETPEYLFITYGGIVSRVLEGAKILRGRGYSAGVILLERLKPYGRIAKESLPYIKSAKKVLFVEEGIKNGGAGMLFGDAAGELYSELYSKYSVLAIDDNFAMPEQVCDLYEFLGLSPGCIAEKILGLPLEK